MRNNGNRNDDHGEVPGDIGEAHPLPVKFFGVDMETAILNLAMGVDFGESFVSAIMTESQPKCGGESVGAADPQHERSKADD